jgi:hypothetical protein
MEKNITKVGVDISQHVIGWSVVNDNFRVDAWIVERNFNGVVIASAITFNNSVNIVNLNVNFYLLKLWGKQYYLLYIDGCYALV